MKGSTSPHPLGACGAECKYQVAFLMKFHPDTFVPDPKKKPRNKKGEIENERREEFKEVEPLHRRAL